MTQIDKVTVRRRAEVASTVTSPPSPQPAHGRSSILGRTTDAIRVRPFKGLFYGPPKTGKTTLAASAPKVLLLDMEGGSMSVRNSGIDVFPAEKWNDIEDALWTLAVEDHPWESVGVDSVSMMQEIAGQEVNLLSDLRGGTDPRRTYSKIAAMVRHKILQFNALPMNVIFTAQLRIRDEEDPEAGQYPLVPDVTPSILRALTAAPDVIGRTFVRDVPKKGWQYAIMFGPDYQSVVGHRDLKLPEVVTGVTIPKLIAMTTKLQQEEANASK